MSRSLQFFTLSRTPPHLTLYSLPSTSNHRFSVTFLKRTTIKASISSDLDSSSQILVSNNGKGGNHVVSTATTELGLNVIEVDAVMEVELKENGFRGTRRTKLVCTIRPTTCGFDQLEALAVGGMNTVGGTSYGSTQFTLTIKCLQN